jgi:aspartyl-tRNA synthetase
MVFQDNYHEVAELIECMLVFVFRGLQERKRFKPLLEAVEKLYPCEANPGRLR